MKWLLQSGYWVECNNQVHVSGCSVRCDDSFGSNGGGDKDYVLIAMRVMTAKITS